MMRRVFVVVMTLSLLAGLAGVAWAAPKEKPPKPPTTTTSPEADKGGLSCHDANLAYPQGTSTVDSWDVGAVSSKTFVLTPADPGRCIDLTTDRALVFEIDVANVDGRLQRLYGNVRDSHPGDICWISWMDLDELPGLTTAIPTATLNACGSEYSENELVDGIEVMKQGTDGETPDPLVLTVLSEWRGKKTGSVEVTVTATTSD